MGWKTICAVEIDKYARNTLLARQRDGILPRFPIWDDITTFDGRPWKGRVDIISGGFPCQDISVAGKGAGITGEKSGLWGEMRRVVCEVEPGFVFVENSPALTLRGLGTVLSDLAEMGYNARWCVLGADDAGAPHRRKRIWILAYTDGCRLKAGEPSKSQKKKINMSELFDIEWWNTDPAELPDTDKQHDDMGGFGAGEILQQEQAGIQESEISDTTGKTPLWRVGELS
ncbi:MAG TPA: DNA cytosine methyltransferase, partial [Desulfobacterales bacterium]|nr:DNA cytosine methyltransferase [Desulfobacterales bacterium]